jgi:hypothetical protein
VCVFAVELDQIDPFDRLRCVLCIYVYMCVCVYMNIYVCMYMNACVYE